MDSAAWAARGGHTETVQLLLDKGANANAADSYGRTALHGAAWGGHTEMVQLLLDKGANAKAATSDGRTALHGAAWRGHTETVQLLLRAVVRLLEHAGPNDIGDGATSADASADDNSGWTALHRFRNNPQLQQLRPIVQTQPRLLEPLLQIVSIENPQLAQLIAQNQDQFLQFLSEDVDENVEDAPLLPGVQTVQVDMSATRQTSHQLYQPLNKERREIRLVTVDRSSWINPCGMIVCHVGTFERGSAPRYDALSYFWGDPIVTKPILLGEFRRQVETKLLAALKIIRRRQDCKYVWIDALCIYSYRTATKCCRNLMFRPQFCEGFGFASHCLDSNPQKPVRAPGAPLGLGCTPQHTAPAAH